MKCAICPAIANTMFSCLFVCDGCKKKLEKQYERQQKQMKRGEGLVNHIH